MIDFRVLKSMDGKYKVQKRFWFFWVDQCRPVLDWDNSPTGFTNKEFNTEQDAHNFIYTKVNEIKKTKRKKEFKKSKRKSWEIV